MPNNREFHAVETIGPGQLVSVFQTVGGPQAYYSDQHDSVLACAAPPGDAAWLETLFARTNAQLAVSIDPAILHNNGSTAAVAHVSPQGILTVANLGDSRATLFVKDSAGAIRAFPLTEDHVPTRADEKARIEKAGGLVIRARAAASTTNFRLAVSRAFGDGCFGDVISHQPEIRTFKLASDFGIRPGDTVYLSVDTDGAHKNMKPDERAQALADALATGDNLSKIPERLSDIAISKGSGDNISVVFTKLEPDRKEPLLLAAFDGHGQNGRAVSQAASRIMGDLVKQDIAALPPPAPKTESTWAWLYRRVFG